MFIESALLDFQRSLSADHNLEHYFLPQKGTGTPEEVSTSPGFK
jgi:hypothetical protein